MHARRGYLTLHILCMFSSSESGYQAAGAADGFPKGLLLLLSMAMFGEGRMDEEGLAEVSHLNCSHKTQELYTERCFDILNGFELTFTRCLNCHKIVGLDAKKFENR